MSDISRKSRSCWKPVNTFGSSPEQSDMITLMGYVLEMLCTLLKETILKIVWHNEVVYYTMVILMTQATNPVYKYNVGYFQKWELLHNTACLLYFQGSLPSDFERFNKTVPSHRDDGMKLNLNHHSLLRNRWIVKKIFIWLMCCCCRWLSEFWISQLPPVSNLYQSPPLKKTPYI